MISTDSLWHYLNISVREYVYLEFWICMNVHRKLQSCMSNQWKIRIWTICCRDDVYYGLTTSGRVERERLFDDYYIFIKYY